MIDIIDHTKFDTCGECEGDGVVSREPRLETCPCCEGDGVISKPADPAEKALPEYGPAIVRAMQIGGITEQSGYVTALYTRLPVRLLGKKDDPENPDHGLATTLLPGHYLTTPPAHGPRPDMKCRVLVVGRNPSYYDQQFHELFSEGSKDHWLPVLERAGIKRESVYVTNLVRFVPPKGTKTLKAAWITECVRLLHEEIRLLKPDVIIAMGRDVVAALFGRGTTLGAVRGDVTRRFESIPVISTVHAHALALDPALLGGFLADISLAASVITNPAILTPKPVEIVRITTAAHLKEVVDACMATRPEWLSVDCEWGAETKSDYLHGKLRSVQFTWETHKAYVVALRKEGLIDMFEGGPAAAVPELKRLIENSGAKLCGHAFRADQKFLEALGISARMFEEGFDTMLGLHLLKPYADGFGLEELSIRHTDLGRYDIPVATWLKANKYGRIRLNARGYGDVPEELLTPYSAYDVMVVLRCVPMLIESLKKTALSVPYMLNGHPMVSLYDVYRQMVHPAGLAINEIEKAGVYTDYDRLLTLIDLFQIMKGRMYEDFVGPDPEKGGINWKGFNFRAVDQVRELLFGVQPRRGRLRPEGARSLELTPLKTTEKPSRDWCNVPTRAIAAGQVSPSTDGETLQILGATYKIAADLRRLRTVDQVIKNFLCQADDEEEEVEAEGSTLSFSRGLAACVDEDMRIRTRIGQLTDSGRYTSAAPNLMNQHKKMEAELRRIFSLDEKRLLKTKGWSNLSATVLKEMGLLPEDYHAIRSCFMAPPGWVMIEADFKQAELNVLAFMSGDPTMIAIVTDPKRDLHSEMAVKAFQLPCTPAEVKKLYPDKRVMAKAVVFGIAYGRGAGAIVRQLKTEGVVLTIEEAQGLIDTFFTMFPKVRDYVDRCKRAVYEQGFVETAWGRRRWFFPTGDNGIDAGLEREAVNHPIQGTVAGCLDLALANFRRYKQAVEPDLEFYIVLPVHDAVLIYARPKDVRHIIDVVIPVCMTWGTTVPSLNMSLQTDIEVKLRWDDHFSDEEVKMLLDSMQKGQQENGRQVLSPDGDTGGRATEVEQDIQSRARAEDPAGLGGRAEGHG